MNKTTNKHNKTPRLIVILVSILAAFGLWAATQSTAYTAAGSSDGDKGESLVAQEDFEWTIPAGGAPYTDGHTVYSNDHKFCFATTAANTSFGDLHTDGGKPYNWTTSFGLGFKLKGGKTYKFTVVFSGLNTDSTRGVKFVQCPTFNGSGTTLGTFVISEANTEHTGVLYVSPTSDTTYWLTGASGGFSKLHSFKCEISTPGLITDSKIWTGSDSETLTGLFAESHMLNVGSSKSPTHNPEITRSYVKHPTYDFTDAENDYVTFKVGKGSGSIRVFYKEPGTVENGSQRTSLLKSGDSFAAATTVASVNTGAVHSGMEATQILTYDFVNSSDVDFYATGGMIGAIEVNMDYDPTTLEPITEDFIWYGDAGALYRNPQGERLAINSIPMTSEGVKLTVNGEANIPASTIDPNATPRQAMAFKLAANTRYVVQIYTDKDISIGKDKGKKLLWISDDASTNYSLGSVRQLDYNDYESSKLGPISSDVIKDNIRATDNWNTTTNTYIYNFAINDVNKERVCWIYPSEKTNIGAIQILPYKHNASLPAEVGASSHNEIMSVEEYKTSKAEDSSHDRNHDLIATSLQENFFYVYGPSMHVNERQINVLPATDRNNANLTAQNSKSIMLTKRNAIGIRLASGAKLTVNYVASDVQYVVVVKSDNASTGPTDDENGSPKNYIAGSVSGAAPNYQITYTNNGSTPEVLWIKGRNSHAYVSGFYIEIDPTKLQTIMENHLYPANETLSNGGTVDDMHIKYHGSGLTANTDVTYDIPTAANASTTGTHSKYYAMGGSDNIGFKLLAGKKGKINVYYYNTDELGYMGSGEAAYNQATRTITFPGTGEYAYNQKGWWFVEPDGSGMDISSVTDKTLYLKFDTSTFEFQIVIQFNNDQQIIYDIDLSTSTAAIDLTKDDNGDNIDYTKTDIKQIYFYSKGNAGSLTILSALIGNDPPLTLYTGSDEDDATKDRLEVVTRVSKQPFKLDNYRKTYIMTHRFNNTQATSDVLYWLSGDVNVAAIEIIYFEDEIEPETSYGYNGYIYINHKDSKKAFPFEAREDYWGKDKLGTNLVQMTSGAKGSTTSKDIMKFMAGTTKVYVYRNGEFQYAGVRWEDQRNAANQGGYLDQYMTSYAGSHVQSKGATGDKKIYDVSYEVNANPQTECNSMIGGPTTEDGGLFLQPISGDFFRFEPEYDGIVTMWILQNGNTDGNTSKNGKLTRRPTYVVDENGRVMRRSEIKPSFDFKNSPSHYSINGTWVDLNTESAIRDDYSVAWNKAISEWNSTWKNNTDNNDYGLRYKETMRMYDFWYDGGTYTNDYVGDNITLDDWVVTESNSNADSQLVTSGDGATTQLKQNQQIGLIIYGSDRFRQLEDEYGFNNWKENKFSKYGYEVPVHVHVRYVFPVRAGKSYYLGGRGTKNDFMGVKFEPMPANYNRLDYIDKTTNYNVSDGPNKAKYMLTAIADGYLRPVEQRKKYDATKVESDYLPSYTNDLPSFTIENNNSTAINWNTYEDKTVNVTVKRKFEADNWYPIVLPFSVSESRMRAIFGADVQVLYLDPYEHTKNRHEITRTVTVDNTETTVTDDWISAYSEAVITSKLKFTRHYYQMLYANVPAFICPGGKLPDGTDFDEISAETGVTFERVHIEKTNLKDITVALTNGTYTYPCGYKIGEVGNYEYYVVGDYVATTNALGTNTEMYYLDNSADSGNATVFHSHNGVAMKATRCWIVVVPKGTGGGAPPRLNEICFGSFYDEDIDVNNANSGIEDIVMDDTTIDMYYDDNVYDLMGRIVGHGSLDGLTPGIYIFRGQKHYIR